MIEGKRIRLRAFEGTDAAANHEFVNDPETLRGMMSGIPFPSSYADEQQWLSQQSSYTRGEYQFAVETVDGDELAGRCGIIPTAARDTARKRWNCCATSASGR